MSLLDIKVGPIPAAFGAIGEQLRAGSMGQLVVADAHGRYYEAASRGNLYAASMQAGAALGTALTATAVTLTLYNPLGSGVLVSLLSCSVAVTTAPAGAASYVYAANVVTNTAVPSSTTSALISGMPLGNASVGKAACYTAATLPAAPRVIRVHSSILATGSTGIMFAQDEVAGAIVLGENSAVTLQGLTTASSGIVSFLWEEIPKV